MPSFLRSLFFAAVAPLLIVSTAPGDPPATAPASPSASATGTASTPNAGPTPYPLAELVTNAEAASATHRAIEAELTADEPVAAVDRDLQPLVLQIDARMGEDAKMLVDDPVLDKLPIVQEHWEKINERLNGWQRDLKTRATLLDKKAGELNDLQKTWAGMPKEVTASAPPEVRQRIKELLAAITKTKARLEEQRSLVLKLQNRVINQAARVSDMIAKVRQARDEAVNRLFLRDSPPIWSREVRPGGSQHLVEDSQSSFAAQRTLLQTYAKRHLGSFVLSALLFAGFLAGLYRMRPAMTRRFKDEPALDGAKVVFAIPVMTALIVILLVSHWMFPHPPRLFRAIWGAASLIPAILVLRRLVERPLFPILNALVAFYFFDQLRNVAAALPTLSRWMFLAEMLGGLLFTLWLLKSAQQRLNAAEAKEKPLRRTLRNAARIALAFFAASMLANALGYVRLSTLVGNAVLGSSYIAVIFYGTIRVGDGLMLSALSLRPLGDLAVVRAHRLLLWKRACRGLRWAAFLLWGFLTLGLLSIRPLVFEKTEAVLNAKPPIPALQSFSLGNLLTFCLMVWASFLLSRFLRFILEEEVYPRARLSRGLPYAISTMLHYSVLVLGFFAALSVLNFSLTQFTVLAGAFGVGLGFGLQNIFNNFVSGLILLFERPIKLGDMIQIDGIDGTVRQIGIRASIIRAGNGSELIVPNGRLISERVTNWTFSDRQRAIEIPLTVPNDADPAQVIALLKAIANDHTRVASNPPPEAVLVKLNPATFEFELRVWTNQFEEWAQVRSDLAIAIHTALREDRIPA